MRALLLRAGPAAAVAALGVTVLAAVLVPFGLWRPLVVLPLLLPVGAVTWWLTRLVPPRPAAGAAVDLRSVWASLAVAAGFGLWAGLTHGEHLVLRRDAGSYALYAQWLATHGGLPVDSGLAAFGGRAALDVPGFTLASPAFYQVVHGGGADVVPQFLVGAPALYSLGWWPAGWTGLFTMPALTGALAVLAAAGLAARLVGPAWAPVAAAALAITQPVLHASRATLSEPLALLLVLGAAALAVDAVERGGPTADDPRVTRWLALAAGAVLGLAGLVRVDVLREVAVAVPVCAALAARRHPAGVPLAGAALGGAALSMVPAWFLSRPYLDTIGASLRPLAAGAVGLAVLSGLGLWLARGRIARLPDELRPGPARPRDRVAAGAAAAAVILGGVFLATRPLWTTVRQSAADSAVPLIASLQLQQGLALDGTRTYAERSVEWVVWYVGPVAAVAALIAAAVLAARAVRWWTGGGTGRAPGWLLPLVVALGSVLLTLYRPGITPDHPWADRRLVPVVLPAVVLAATGAAAWAVRRARAAGGPTPTAPVTALVAALVGVALLVPPALATAPLALSRTEVGQPGAAARVCAELRPGDAVVAVEDARGGLRARNEWVQVVRGVCGHPSAALETPVADRPAALARIGVLVRDAGGRLVLLSAGENDESASGSLTALGLEPRRAALLRTREDQHLLARRPDGVSSLMIDVWLAVWPPPAAG